MNVFHTHDEEFELRLITENMLMAMHPKVAEAQAKHGKSCVVVGALDSNNANDPQTFIFNTDSRELTVLDTPRLKFPSSYHVANSDALYGNSLAICDVGQNSRLLTNDDDSSDAIECIQVDTDTKAQRMLKNEVEAMRLDFDAKVAALRKQMEDAVTKHKIEQQIVETINQRASEIQIEQELKEAKEEKRNLITEKQKMEEKAADAHKELMSTIEEKENLIQEYERQRKARLEFDTRVATLRNKMEGAHNLEQEVVETIHQSISKMQVEQELKAAKEEKENLIEEKQKIQKKAMVAYNELMTTIDEKDFIIQAYERQVRSVRRLVRQAWRLIVNKIVRRPRISE